MISEKSFKMGFFPLEINSLTTDQVGKAGTEWWEVSREKELKEHVFKKVAYEIHSFHTWLLLFQ